MSLKSILFFFFLILINCCVIVKSDSSHLPGTHRNSKIPANENQQSYNQIVTRAQVAQELMRIGEYGSKIVVRLDFVRSIPGRSREQQQITERINQQLIDTLSYVRNEILAGRITVEQQSRHRRLLFQGISTLNTHLTSVLEQYPQLHEQELILQRQRAQEQITRQQQQLMQQQNQRIQQQSVQQPLVQEQISQRQYIQQQNVHQPPVQAAQQQYAQQQQQPPSDVSKRASFQGQFVPEQPAQKIRRLENLDYGQERGRRQGEKRVQSIG